MGSSLRLNEVLMNMFTRRRHFMALVPGVRSKMWIVLLFLRLGDLSRRFGRAFETRPILRESGLPSANLR